MECTKFDSVSYSILQTGISQLKERITDCTTHDHFYVLHNIGAQMTKKNVMLIHLSHPRSLHLSIVFLLWPVSALRLRMLCLAWVFLELQDTWPQYALTLRVHSFEDTSDDNDQQSKTITGKARSVSHTAPDRICGHPTMEVKSLSTNRSTFVRSPSSLSHETQSIRLTSESHRPTNCWQRVKKQITLIYWRPILKRFVCR